MSKRNSVIRSDDSTAFIIPVTGEEDEEEEVLEQEEEASDEVADQQEGGSGDEEQNDESSGEEDDWKAKYEEAIARSEKDIAAVKSALDKTINKVQKDNEAERKRLEKIIDELRESTMDDDTRRAYRDQKSQSQLQDLENKLAEAEAQVNSQQSKSDWANYFVRRGIPLEKLDFTLDVDNFVATGLKEMDAVLEKYKNMANNTQSTAKPKKSSKKPPKVVQPTDTGLSKETSLQDLANKYANGSQDELFSLSERNPEIRKLLDQWIENQES